MFLKSEILILDLPRNFEVFRSQTSLNKLLLVTWRREFVEVSGYFLSRAPFVSCVSAVTFHCTASCSDAENVALYICAADCTVRLLATIFKNIQFLETWRSLCYRSWIKNHLIARRVPEFGYKPFKAWPRGGGRLVISGSSALEGHVGVNVERTLIRIDRFIDMAQGVPRLSFHEIKLWRGSPVTLSHVIHVARCVVIPRALMSFSSSPASVRRWSYDRLQISR